MVLPVVPTPADGESLRSYIHRLEERNHQRPQQLIQMWSAGVSTDWAKLVSLTGLPVSDLQTLGWEGYTPSILGRGGSTGWRLRTARWWCPNCQPIVGAWQRSWELACVPVCLRCRTILARYPEVTSETLTIEQAEVFQAIWHSVDSTRTDRRVAAKFGRLLRVTRLLAVTSETDWPQPSSGEIVAELNDWGHHPPDAPAALAHLIPYVYRLVGTRSEQVIVHEAWVRLGYRDRTIARTLLPKPSAKPPRARLQPSSRISTLHSETAKKSPLDRHRAKNLISELASLDSEMVPALIQQNPNQFLPRETSWSMAQKTALALHMLTNPRRGGRPDWISEAQRHLHLPRTRPTQILASLEGGRISSEAAEDIRQAAGLCSAQAINYKLRREILIGLHHAPRMPINSFPNEVLLGWLWVYLTHGRVVITGPSWIHIDHPLPTRIVVETHQQLSLEQRLRLAEYGDQLWTTLTGEDLVGVANLKPARHSAMNHARLP